VSRRIPAKFVEKESCHKPGGEESGEERLIATYFRPIATHPGAFALGDDAAAIAPPPGADIVLTTDGLVSGVHFLPDDPPVTIAKKALRINLSDLAAKGAAPLGFLMSIGLPADLPPDWLHEFARGLREDAEAYGCPLLGGDTDKIPGTMTAAGTIAVHITALGTVPRGTMVRRAGAHEPSIIAVTGTIGDAALGLLLRKDAGLARRWKLDAAMRDHLIGRYRLPQPRMSIAAALRGCASAAMDVSDGLVGDLAKLCRASGVGADIAVDTVPLSAAARAALTADPTLIETILTGGDDFEIVALVPPNKVAALWAEAISATLAITAIGTVTETSREVRFLNAEGEVLSFRRPSYSHF
jgi:thiamine-monophosphate kinase